MDKKDKEWLEAYNEGIKAGAEHSEPSQETLRRFEKIDLALFGDGKNNKGIVIMTKEMHNIFASTRFTGKVILGFFASAGIISGGIFAIVKLVKTMSA